MGIALSHLMDSCGLELGHRSQGPYGDIWEFSGPNGLSGSITLHETPERVVLDTIDLEPMGCGAGTRIMEALRESAEMTGRSLCIPGVMNLEFFSRFPWLSWQEPKEGSPLWSAKYEPEVDRAAP